MRADATPGIGAGHVMRCCGLAEAWARRRYGGVRVWGDVQIDFAQARLSAIGAVLGDGSAADDAVLVVDTYDADVRHALAGCAASLRVLVDDVGGTVSGYDAIWNPNAYAAANLYPGFSGLVISGHVPLRTGLPMWTGGGDSIAVMIGGGAPSPIVVEALSEWTRGRDVVAAEAPWLPAAWHRAPRDAAWDAFARCNLLITASGSTVWEAAAVGIPVCVIITADNQHLVARWVHEHGAPVVDARALSAQSLCTALDDATHRATALPRIASGAGIVADTLYALARAG